MAPDQYQAVREAADRLKLNEAGHPQELDDFDRALTGWDGESGVSLRGVGDGCFDA